METEEGKGEYQTTSIVRNKLVRRKKTHHMRTKSTTRTGISSYFSLWKERPRSWHYRDGINLNRASVGSNRNQLQRAKSTIPGEKAGKGTVKRKTLAGASPDLAKWKQSRMRVSKSNSSKWPYFHSWPNIEKSSFSAWCFHSRAGEKTNSFARFVTPNCISTRYGVCEVRGERLGLRYYAFSRTLNFPDQFLCKSKFFGIRSNFLARLSNAVIPFWIAGTYSRIFSIIINKKY